LSDSGTEVFSSQRLKLHPDLIGKHASHFIRSIDGPIDRLMLKDIVGTVSKRYAGLTWHEMLHGLENKEYINKLDIGGNYSLEFYRQPTLFGQVDHIPRVEFFNGSGYIIEGNHVSAWQNF